MLRLAVLVLLLANGLYFAWSQSLLAGWGPARVTEPERLQQQVRPELMQLLPPRQPASAPAAAPPTTPSTTPSTTPASGAASSAAADAASTGESGQPVSNVVATTSATAAGRIECLIVGLFNDAQATGIRQALSDRLPANAWTLESVVTTPGRWIVYMGRYPNTDWVERKKAELRALKVRYDALANPALEPGLSLGRFDTEEAAAQELGNLTKRGVRTAHVAVERAEVRGMQLRLPAADDTVRARLDEVKLALAGKPAKPCAA